MLAIRGICQPIDKQPVTLLRVSSQSSLSMERPGFCQILYVFVMFVLEVPV